MRVLITGAGGFIGTHLVGDQLSRGRHVTALDINTSTLERFGDRPGLTVLEADFRDPGPLDPILADHQVCFHLASLHLQTHVSETDYRAVNIDGAMALVRRCHEAGVGRFVHVSSVGVHGIVEEPLANETSAARPDNIYEVTKWEGEQRVSEYGREHDYPVVVIRPAWVYGPGCPRTKKLVESIRKGHFFYVGDGMTLRHPIFIDDLLSGFELAATHPAAPGNVFIMAGPQAVTVRELVEEIARSLDTRSPSIRLPRILAWMGGLVLEGAFSVLGRSAPFSRRSLRFFSGNSAFSTEKAYRMLDFSPETSLREGFYRTLGA